LGLPAENIISILEILKCDIHKILIMLQQRNRIQIISKGAEGEQLSDFDYYQIEMDLSNDFKAKEEVAIFDGVYSYAEVCRQIDSTTYEVKLFGNSTRTMHYSQLYKFSVNGSPPAITVETLQELLNYILLNLLEEDLERVLFRLLSIWNPAESSDSSFLLIKKAYENSKKILGDWHLFVGKIKQKLCTAHCLPKDLLKGIFASTNQETWKRISCVCKSWSTCVTEMRQAQKRAIVKHSEPQYPPSKYVQGGVQDGNLNGNTSGTRFSEGTIHRNLHAENFHRGNARRGECRHCPLHCDT